MFRIRLTLCCIVATSLVAPQVYGHSLFRKALIKKYEFRSVSCNVCHVRRSEVSVDDQARYSQNPKSFRNAFGERLAERLKGKSIIQRLYDVKHLDYESKNRVHNEIREEFLDALETVEKMKHPDGGTYGEALRTGRMKGVHIRD